MNQGETFSNSIYVNQTLLTERELSAFISAVAELFGPEQARRDLDDMCLFTLHRWIICLQSGADQWQKKSASRIVW